MYDDRGRNVIEMGGGLVQGRDEREREGGRISRSLITSTFAIQTEVLFELIRPIFIPLLHARNKGKNNAQ